MEVLILLIFVSLVLVTAAIGFFAWGLREHVYDHVDRLALLPLEEEGAENRTRMSSFGGTGNEPQGARPANGRKSCAEESGSGDG